MSLVREFASVASNSRPRILRDDKAEVVLAAERFRRYLACDEGKAALAMLARTKEDIQIGTRPAPGFAEDYIYYLDGGGIRRDVEMRVLFEGYRPVASVRLTPEEFDDYFWVLLRMWRDERSVGRRMFKPSSFVPALRRTLKEFAERHGAL